MSCGERAGEPTGIINIGIPNATFAVSPTSSGCKTEAEEKTAVEKEETERKGCYESPVPAGCIKVNVIQPALGLETVFEGSQHPSGTNGFGSGLNASAWSFEGAASGRLRLSTTFATTGTTTGGVHEIGFAASELMTVK